MIPKRFKTLCGFNKDAAKEIAQSEAEGWREYGYLYIYGDYYFRVMVKDD